MSAPINPSQVLLGDIGVRGRFINLCPMAKPQKYAIISLQIIKEHGNKNQIRPLKMF